MNELKLETIKRLESLLKITTPGFSYLIPLFSRSNGELEKVVICINGSSKILVEVKGDSPYQIVKDILNTVWRMK